MAASEFGRRAVRRRLLSLGTGEFTAAAVFVLAAAVFILPRLLDGARWPIWCAVAPLVFILVQAGCYWMLRWSRLGRPLPGWFAPTYGLLRIINPVLLVLAGVAIGFTWGAAGPSGRLLAVAAWAFGLVEYLNYFVVRLSYPAVVWMREVGAGRTPALVRDLRRSSRRL